LIDVNAPESVWEKQIPFDLNFSEQAGFSDIILTESMTPSTEETIYTKSNYELVPNVISFYTEKLDKIGFYAELYNIDKSVEDSVYLLSYAVMDDKMKNPVQGLRKFKKMSAKPVEVILSEFNIAEVPSGNYRLLIEARDKKNELIASTSTAFQRSKPGTVQPQVALEEIKVEDSFVSRLEVEKLSYYLSSILPVLEGKDHQIVLNLSKSDDVELMQKGLLYNWAKLFPHNSGGEFATYQTVVDAINEAYGNTKINGFDTDRGRMFLKYGQPTDIVQAPADTRSLPYEVWTYQKVGATGQTNVKSIFYEPNMGTNMYPLLHSEIRGERRNDNWEDELHRGNDSFGDDPFSDRDSKASEIFNDFKIDSGQGDYDPRDPR